jgi:CSLREA domain-containing protein
MRRFLQVPLALLTLLTLTFTAVGVMPAYAITGANLVVNTVTDENASNSNCSLREAIIAANSDADYNGCVNSAGIYGADAITFADNYTITLVGSQLPDVTSEMTITGKGAANTIINANAGSGSQRRAFYVSSTGNLTLNGLAVQNGYCASSCATPGSYGGGINNSGTLTVTNSAFSGNYASFGGGINNSGTLTVTNSTFSGNSASYGGGVRHNSGTLVITNSTFSGNSALYGGGVSNYNVTLTITNSTFSWNSANGSGGNIDNYSGTVTLKNTIVANYTSGGDCSGVITADAYNLDSDGSCGGATQKTGLEIKLGALADNGGSAQTLALLPGSVAIDAGDDTVCDDSPGPNNLDQRGVTRPHGAHCDIGAFEQTGSNFTVNSSADTDDGVCGADCTLREAINAANAISGADTITFDAGYTITLGSQLPVVNTYITITGSGAANTIIQASDCNPITLKDSSNADCAAAAYRVFQVISGGNLTLDSLTVRHGNEMIFSGGGIYNNNGTLTVTNSTLSGNSANYGGGIYNLGTLTITNSAFSGNSASDYGGGVINDVRTLTIINSTFSGNSASYGGGIASIVNTATLKNTIVANSTSGGDCSGVISADGYNLDSDGSCGGAVTKTSAEINLGALADNGGPTETFALLPGSAAIDAGDTTVCDDNPGPNNLDQRGVSRVGNGDHCDIGAYETEAQPGPTFIVNTNADTDDLSCDSLGSGIGNKDCTLREAINAANAISGADTITFDTSLNGKPITLVGSQLPAVTSEIAITGNGAVNTIVQASTCNPVTDSCSHDYRVLEVTSAGNLTLNSLTVQHGRFSNGGGAYNVGMLTMTNSTFSANRATTGSGGGVYNSSGTLSVTDSTFSDNNAFGNGGGIRNNGTLAVTNSTFSNNSTSGGYGGGIANNSGRTLTVTNSTFSSNSAKDGGGIDNVGTLTVTNSTFSANSATAGSGGGVYSSGTLNLYNTILANSTSGSDCYNLSAVNGDHNLIELNISCGTPLITDDPNLGSLTDNGGSTETFALLPGSAAIDAGDTTVCDDNPGPNNLDQRGVSRIGNGGHCDIGAYESRGFTLTKTGGDNQSAIINTAFTDLLSVTLNETGGRALPGVTITFTAPSSGASITSTGETAPTNASGIASISVTANGTVGSYNVTASAAGASSIDLALSNTTTYTLTYTAGANGSITTPATSPTTHSNGTSVPITAVPDTEYHFVNWTGDVDTVADVNAADITITMDGDYVITANFAINTYDLTYTAGAGGTIDGTTPQTINSGDNGTAVTAVADPGYHFVDWSDGIFIASRTDLHVLANISVTANFAINTYTLTYAAGANGSITGDSPQTVNSGADGTEVTAVADPGYHFVNWSDGVLTASRTDIAVSGDISVTANFAINTTTQFYSVSTYDGWVLESGEKTSRGGSLDSKATTFRLGDDAAKKQYRGILSFSTKGLPDNATITKVTLKVRKQGIVGGGNPVTTFKGFMADMRNGYFGTAGLATADFQTAASKTYGPFKTAISGVWYSIDLTSGSNYINKLSTSSGLTQIRLRFYLDDNNNTTANYLSLYSGNISTVANRPQLVIEYYEP